jgi:uncharacterized membrane protein
MLRVQIAVMVLGVAAIIFYLGAEFHPHRWLLAIVIAVCYLVVMVVVTYRLQRSWRAAARQAAAGGD